MAAAVLFVTFVALIAFVHWAEGPVTPRSD